MYTPRCYELRFTCDGSLPDDTIARTGNAQSTSLVIDTALTHALARDRRSRCDIRSRLIAPTQCIHLYELVSYLTSASVRGPARNITEFDVESRSNEIA